MNSIRDIAMSDASQLGDLQPTRPAELKLPTKRIFEGPRFDGKQCAVCQRKFKSSGEYITCKLCKEVVCRRKADCKHLHHAKHRMEFLKSRRKEEA